ncbi:unnamed protein product [Cuscuta campestris]|uniref:Aminotransferase-like plant mobile domain-containing protein n=1 Tax=Cuscuta campestris TaxID=132261 RepID=A0A484LH51_9ASTE|nr:unnamed protein product [Cuscuta campestris]
MYSASARQNVRYFRNELDCLQFRNVVWQPYDIDNLPAYCRRSPQLWTFQGYVIYRSIIEPVMPMRFTRQFGMLQIIPELTHPYTEAYHKPKGCKSTQTVQACVAQWRDNRFALTVFHEMEPIVGENPFQITVEYANWFARYGRRIIGNPYHRPLEGSENTSAKLAFLVNTIKKAERRLGKVPGAVAAEVRENLRGALENFDPNENELLEDEEMHGDEDEFDANEVETGPYFPQTYITQPGQSTQEDLFGATHFDTRNLGGDNFASSSMPHDYENSLGETIADEVIDNPDSDDDEEYIPSDDDIDTEEHWIHEMEAEAGVRGISGGVSDGLLAIGTVVDVVYASEPPNLNATPEETPRFKTTDRIDNETFLSSPRSEQLHDKVPEQ